MILYRVAKGYINKKTSNGGAKSTPTVVFYYYVYTYNVYYYLIPELITSYKFRLQYVL